MLRDGDRRRARLHGPLLGAREADQPHAAHALHGDDEIHGTEYRPPVGSQKWLSRFAWMDGAGDRWWPVFGAVYFVVAVKRVRGMRLVGLARAEQRSMQASAAPVAVTQHQHNAHRGPEKP